ncbi:DedA family protein [Undibacterium sp. Ji67W]|uniref:DedA family protein n=1 Tax=Undibacterium sp. Ji67W TaxID=3413042 RepID=UPI003BEF6BC2
MIDLTSISHTMAAALQGMTAPWLICLALLVTTFVVEDVAIAAGVALAAHGSLSWSAAFFSVAIGIAFGDIGLYFIGLSARRIPYLRRKYVESRSAHLRGKLEQSLPSAIFFARAIPGLRLVTYTLCGFSQIRLFSFVLLVVIAVSMWTGILFVLSSVFGKTLAQISGIPLPLAAALPIIFIALSIHLVRQFLQQRTSTSHY